MVERKVELCVVCAWREHCKKKYSISKDPLPHCPDFSRDVTIRDKATDHNKLKSPKNGPKG
jgi:hypothetical protein